MVLPTIADVSGLYRDLNVPVPLKIMDEFTVDKFNSDLMEKYMNSFSSQQETISSFFNRFGVYRQPPAFEIIRSVVYGILLGILFSLFTFFGILPASIAMNMNAHHHWCMRIVVGLMAAAPASFAITGLMNQNWSAVILGGTGALVFIIGALIFRFIGDRGPFPYFGVIPLLNVSNWKLMSAFNMKQDSDLMNRLVHNFVFPKTSGTPVVTQEIKTLFEQSRKAAAEKDGNNWKTEMDKIQSATIPQITGWAYTLPKSSS
jgi:hypothetical protein